MYRILVAFLVLVVPAAAHDLSGRVLELHSEEAVEQARLRLSPVDDPAAGREYDATDDGAFRLAGLAAGHYRLDINSPSHAATTVYIRLDSDRTIMPRLARRGAIAGLVGSADGAPLRAASVVARRAAPGIAVFPAQTDDRGAFRLFGLPPGDYDVSAAGVTVTGLRINSGDTHRDIRLTAPAGAAHAIAGAVSPVYRAGPLLLCLLRRDAPHLVLDRTIMKQDGTFRFSAVPPGAFEILAAGPSLYNAGLAGVLGPDPVFGRAAVEVLNQDASGVTLAVNPGASLNVRLGTDCAPRANISLRSLDNWGAPLERTTTVVRDAPAVLAGLAPARYALRVNDPAGRCFTIGPEVYDFTAAIPTALSLSLRPGAILEGQTANPAVWLWSGDPALIMLVPDSSGAFLSGPLRPGRYRAAATADPAAAIPVDLLPGARTRLELPVPAK